MKPLNVSERALEAVATYNQSIHGKLVRLGSQKAANCVSCHASPSLHDIYKKDSPRATISKANIQKTCRQCHEKTNPLFIEIAVHPSPEHKDNPIIYLVSIFLDVAIYGTVISMVGLMMFETFGRRREGIRLLLVAGTSWRAKTKPGS
jgi:NAD-dependent SIR2 family protein deacetylase